MPQSRHANFALLRVDLLAIRNSRELPSYNGIGCNYTKGGEGRPCSEEMKQRMRDKIRSQYENGRQPWNKGKHGQLTYNLSEEQRQQARDRIIAYNKSCPSLGKHHKEETKIRMRKPHMCSICKTLGHTKTTCPDRPSDAINQVTIAQQKRHDRKQNQNDPGAT